MKPPAQMYDDYLAAEQAILQGKEVRWSNGGTDRMLRQEDLQWVQAGRREWERKAAAATAAATGRPTIGGLGFAVARFDTPL